MPARVGLVLLTCGRCRSCRRQYVSMGLHDDAELRSSWHTVFAVTVAAVCRRVDLCGAHAYGCGDE